MVIRAYSDGSESATSNASETEDSRWLENAQTSPSCRTRDTVKAKADVILQAQVTARGCGTACGTTCGAGADVKSHTRRPPSGKPRRAPKLAPDDEHFKTLASTDTTAPTHPHPSSYRISTLHPTRNPQHSRQNGQARRSHGRGVRPRTRRAS